MNRSLLLSAFSLSFLISSGCAPAQTVAPIAPVAAKPEVQSLQGHTEVVKVGKGSYASYPPPEVIKKAQETLGKTLYLTDDAKNKPIPTNKWWTNLLIDRYAGQIWTFPHQVKADQDGLQLFFPTRWNDSGSDPISENPLKIGGQNFAPADARAKNWSDWLVTFRLGENNDKYFDVTLGRGLPYVWIEAKGVQPKLQIDNNAKFFGLDGADEALPANQSTLGLEFGGRSYGLFAPSGSHFTRDGDTISLEGAAPNPFLVVCPLPARKDLATFAKFAFAIPRDSQVSWDYNPKTATVETRWHLETQVLQGTEKRLIQGWLPHHYRGTKNNLVFNGMEYLTPRGTMKCAVGTDFTIAYPFTGIVPALPAPQVAGYDEARMRDYVARYATRTEYGDDTYWGGKHLVQWGDYLSMARQMKDPNGDKLRDELKTALTDWMTYTPGEKSHFFARYPNWGALIGFDVSYGSEGFNDQHFHLGYFTTSAALLGLDDPQFLKDYGPMMRLVAKQYANWERSDKDFPFFRTIDLWEGHSWAGGFSGGTGNNQESSSEAMQSWGGLFLLGETMGDKAMAAAGAMGYAMESRATQEYWFNQNGGNWSPNWKHDVVGMVWSGGNNYGTYFSGDPAWIYGIQWLPMSPTLAYLVENPDFAKKNFGAMWADKKAKDGDVDIAKMGPALGNVILGQAAQVNPDWAAQQMDDLWAKNDKVAHDNDTPGIVYYMAHTNRTLGQIQWDTTIDLPMSRVYFNPKTKKFTYIAFNPTDAAQMASVYKAGKVIGKLSVPARGFVSVNQLR